MNGFMVQLNNLIDELRAIGEITRFRILSLLSQGELCVKDIKEIIGQSQPRISRHLKILTDAGLITRYSEGAWAYFSINNEGQKANLILFLLSSLDKNEQILATDNQRLAKLHQEMRNKAEKYFAKIAKDWDKLRSLYISETKVEEAIYSLTADKKYDLMLDLGTGTGRMLELLANNYKRAIGIDLSKEMLAIARSKLALKNIVNAQVRLGDIRKLNEYKNKADLVIIHQVLHYFDDPKIVLNSAANSLKMGGEIIIVDFAPHNFEFLRTEHAHRRMGFSTSLIKKWADQINMEIKKTIEIAKKNEENSLKISIWQLGRN